MQYFKRQIGWFCLMMLFMSGAGEWTSRVAAQGVPQPNQGRHPVQFSGLVLDGSTNRLYPVPYANIYIPGTTRGTFSDLKGFFSLVVEKGEQVTFSAIGYKAITITIPDTLSQDRYSLVQLMSSDTINLPETVVFPWPSREHFKSEFLAMDVTQEMQERALANVAQEVLEKGRSLVRTDGNEHGDLYLRQQSRQYYHYGQMRPMQIFSPTAWNEFFNAWKRGDFKKKKSGS
jgi:hypothetical protein